MGCSLRRSSQPAINELCVQVSRNSIHNRYDFCVSIAREIASLLCQSRNSREPANFSGEAERFAMESICHQLDSKAQIEHIRLVLAP